MREHVLILGGIVGVSLTTILAPVLWVLTRPFSRWPRRLLRILFVPVVVLVFERALGLGMSFGETGRWMCFVCRAVERRTEYLGVPVYRTTDVEGEVGVEECHEFEAWFRERIGIEHDHAWTRVGCHRVGPLILCHPNHGEREGQSFYACLRRISDRRILVHLVERWIQAPPEDRFELIGDFHQTSLGWPIAEIYDGEPLSETELRAGFDGWLERHPGMEVSAMEVCRIDPLSAGKVTGVLCAIAGGTGGALGVVLVFVLKPSAPSEDPLLVILGAFIGLCAYPALCFMIGAAAGMLFAAVFNTTARRIGGLSIELSGTDGEERPASPKSTLPGEGGSEEQRA